MKAILEFDLSEPEDVQAHMDAVQGADWKILAQQTLHEIRNKIKYSELSEEQISVYESIREYILQTIEDYGLPTNHL